MSTTDLLVPLADQELRQIPESIFDGSGPLVLRLQDRLVLLHTSTQGMSARRLRRILERALSGSIGLELVEERDLIHWHSVYRQALQELAPEPVQQTAAEDPSAEVSALPSSSTEGHAGKPAGDTPPADAASPQRLFGRAEAEQAESAPAIQAVATAEEFAVERIEPLPADQYHGLPEMARNSIRQAAPALFGESLIVVYEDGRALIGSRLQKVCTTYLRLPQPPDMHPVSAEQLARLMAIYNAMPAPGKAEESEQEEEIDDSETEEENQDGSTYDPVEESAQRRVLDQADYEKIPPGLRAAETVVLVKENEADLLILHNPKALLAARRLQQACQTHLNSPATLKPAEGLIIRSFRDAYTLRADPDAREKKAKGSLEDEASKTDVGRTIKDIIQHAAVLQATDVHIELRSKLDNTETVSIRYRVSGDLIDGPMELSGARGAQVANWLFSQGRRNNPQWVRHAMLDGVADVSIADPAGGGMRQVQLRLANLPEIRGWDLIIRILNPGQSTISLQQLGYKPLQLDLLREAFARPYGIIIFSGPTGSGKSTSMLAALETLPANLKIVSLEQPVERPLHNTSHVTTADEAALSKAIPSVNRWDGNVTVLGELRDQPSARALKDFTTSGKLTVITLHASNALTVPTRMAELSVEWSMLADPNFLVALVNQRLVARLCPSCRRPLEDNWDDVPSYRRPDFEQLFGTGKDIFLRGTGCSRRGCRKGVISRLLCAEVVLVDDRDRTFIEKQNLLDWRKDLLERGWMPIAGHALERVRAGEIDPISCEQSVGPLSGSIENIVDYRAREALLQAADAAENTPIAAR